MTRVLVNFAAFMAGLGPGIHVFSFLTKGEDVGCPAQAGP